MKLKQIDSSTGDWLEDMLIYNGIDINYHRNPNGSYEQSVDELDGIFDKASKLLDSKLRYEGTRIGILVDSDVDGWTSSTLFYRVLNEFKNNISANLIIRPIIPEGKTHGLVPGVMEEIYKEDIELLIILDASSNDVEQHKELVSNGIDLLVLDHHETDYGNLEYSHNETQGYVINNQSTKGLNPHYTGVGMTYLFLRYWQANTMFEHDYNLEQYLDLVTLGQTGDVSDISQVELRNQVVKGTRNINNPFLKATLEQKGIENVTTRDLSFSAISMMNAVVRVGTMPEKRQMFEALTKDTNQKFIIEKRKKDKSTGLFNKIPMEVSYYTNTVLLCEKIKRRQDKQVKEAMKDIEYISQDKLIIGLLPEYANNAITGLVAMKLSSKYRKPTLIGKAHETYYTGSLRDSTDYNLKDFLINSNLFDFVQGHASAAGWKIDKDRMDSLVEYANDNLDTTGTTYYVDKLNTEPNELDIWTVENNKYLFGGKLNYPLFGYEELSIHKSCIKTRGSVLELYENGVSFILFNSNDLLKRELYDNMVNERVTVNIVGEPTVNRFSGRETPQIVIQDIEVIQQNNNDDWGIDF